MPKTTNSGQPRDDELPGTIKRSDPKAKRTFAKAHASAADHYDDEERAHRVAYRAHKHTHEKVGDHWEPKEDSDPRTSRPRVTVTRTERPPAVWMPTRRRNTCTGSPARLRVNGRSSMSKRQLVEAIEKANDRQSNRARHQGRQS